MAQITSGFRRILSSSSSYQLLQDFLGARRAYRQFVDTSILPYPGQRILDIGCGPATLFEYLPVTVEYVGMDISEEYITTARQRYGRRAVFHCSALEKMSPRAFSNFDLVLGVGLLHHLDQKPAERFFALAARVLNFGGRCLTVDSCLVPGQHPFARLLIALDRGKKPTHG
ncbi:MAG: class I SAM-dependent methyltransferase [Proteobacteria bacterium]|nr:class I SAM-dependent methyltransferase [Desulfobulbaceae bacterium]MBU4152039.1 class I SAM-dependent methyltransferase [Pseudomonadota bacterium]